MVSLLTVCPGLAVGCTVRECGINVWAACLHAVQARVVMLVKQMACNAGMVPDLENYRRRSIVA